MVEIPAAVIYIGAVASVIVCGFLAVFLYYLIKLTKQALRIAAILEQWEENIEGNVRKVGRMLRLANALFRSE